MINNKKTSNTPNKNVYSYTYTFPIPDNSFRFLVWFSVDYNSN